METVLHADLYRENVAFDMSGNPVLLDPLPMRGNAIFDWAFWSVYYRLGQGTVRRLRLAVQHSGADMALLLQWCLLLSVDGLLYYEETVDLRADIMAVVPLTNLYADEIIPPSELPLALTAQTPCFRSEAGSYGRDTRGLIRQHQFSKVEMVRICAPEDSRAQMELMVTHAETCLKELDLVYRVVTLAAGDTGFSSQLTYDIEVWLPSQRTYREISSVSDFGTFQGRRAGIRTRDEHGKTTPAATVNGSGLPIGRTLAAVLEQHQQSDGSVLLPKSLARYLGFCRIMADGSLSEA